MHSTFASKDTSYELFCLFVCFSWTSERTRAEPFLSFAFGPKSSRKDHETSGLHVQTEKKKHFILITHVLISEEGWPQRSSRMALHEEVAVTVEMQSLSTVVFASCSLDGGNICSPLLQPRNGTYYAHRKCTDIALFFYIFQLFSTDNNEVHLNICS